MGGAENPIGLQKWVDEYIPSTGQWRQRDDLNLSLVAIDANTVRVDNNVFIISGSNIQIWNGTSDRFEAFPESPVSYRTSQTMTAFVLNAD